MNDFGPAAFIGLCVGFMFGFGCSLAILYSIYLGGYRKAVEDSQAATLPKRWRDAVEKLRLKREKLAGK